MTDRELLELAAKAAGLQLFDGEYGDKLRVYYTCPHTGLNRYAPWNPIADDGDALRLAVRLGIDLEIQGELYGLTSNDHTIATNQNSDEYWEPSNPDPYAATRRAIVRAAAEIGKAHSAASIGGNT